MTLVFGALIFWVSAWILNAKLADSALADKSTLPNERPLDIRDSSEFISISQRVREGLRSGHSYE